MKVPSFSEPKQSEEPPFALLSNIQVNFLSCFNRRQINRYWEEIREINQLALSIERNLDSPEILDSTLIEVTKLARCGSLLSRRKDVYLALVLLRFLSSRSLGIRPYDVQLLCALAMLDGYLVQLAPGEGKTLTLALVSVVHGWSGQPCHVITANDYLAERDANEMRPLFAVCGLKVSAVTQNMSPSEKSSVYQQSVVYSTAKQLLADFLHDKLLFGAMPSRTRLNMQALKGQQTNFLMRGLYSVIIDEADSVLIDDATTPLIISAPEPNPLLVEAVHQAKDLVDLLLPEVDYILEKEQTGVRFTKKGFDLIKCHQSNFPRLWHSQKRFEDLLYQAIMARDHFQQDQHYVLLDGKVVIVDESTGRMMPGRSWSYGLHQAIEARAGVDLTDPSKTMEKMSFQNFFKLYHRLTGASGTLQNIHQEVFYNYKVRVLEVPSRLKPNLRVWPYKSYMNKEAKIQALIEKVENYHHSGWPVLVGTRNILDSEDLSKRLTEKGLSFDLLNAKFPEREAEIVKFAGQPFKITIATNMAGRGTDIKVSPEVLSDGGLRVLMLEPHESSRIDWQLFGRTGRQGQSGEAIPYVSLEDTLLKEHLPLWLKPILYCAIKLSFLPNKPLNMMVYLAQKNAQNKAFRKRRLINKMLRESKDRLSFVRSQG